MAEYEEISNKSVQDYTSCYCEENVWKLCEKICHSKNLAPLLEEESVFAIFISNDNKTVPLWCQLASQDQEGYVVWDYHVILVIKGEIININAHFREQFIITLIKIPRTIQNKHQHESYY